MKHFCSFTSILILAGLQMVVENEALLESLLQRGGKSIIWTWSHQFPRTDSSRRRRFSSDESSTTWWKQMQKIHDRSPDLSPGEETYFTGTGQNHPPPFDNPEKIPPMNETTEKSELERESPDTEHHHSIDTTLLRELIIEEHHRPSKIELKSVSQRLRDASGNTPDKTKETSSVGESTTTKEMEDSTVAAEPERSSVEYVVPGVEHVVSHVEYVNNFDAYQELEEFRIKPTVEYVEPEVEFVEPEIEYFVSTKMSNISDSMTTYSMKDGYEREKELEEEYFPIDEYITVDQERFLQVRGEDKFTASSKKSGHESSRRTGSSSRQSKRIYRRNPEKGVPEVDYPTLEILPVVHFPCEEYASPGYYADVASRCQMFHVCHKDGQRTSFLCPVGTVFNQEYLVCDWWYNVDCDNTLRQDKPESSLGPNDHSLEAATMDLNKKIDALRLGEMPNRYISSKSSAFPQIREKATLEARTNQQEDKSKEKSQNLAQKAMNYPMGYAILLRELMKHSAPPEPQPDRNTEYANSKEVSESQDDSPQNSKVVNLEERKSKIGWSARQRKEFQKEQKRQEYFGGSKPFAVSSGKKTYKNVRIRRIKLKYRNPDSQDITFIQNITEKPFAETYRYEHWPERKLPRPEGIISRQRTSEEAQYGRPTNLNNENYPLIEHRNRWTYANPSINPIQRNDQNIRNITDDFEVIYPLHRNYNHNSRRNRISMKNYNYHYNSAESNVEHTEEQIGTSDSSNNLKKATPTRNSELEENHENTNTTRGIHYAYIIKKALKDAEEQREARSTTKRPSEIATYVKSSPTKKAYILEPEPFPKTNTNKKFGERLCFGRTCSSAAKSEVVTATTKLPVTERTKSTQRAVIRRRTQPFNERNVVTTQPSPVYMSSERFKVSEKGLESILGMKLNKEAVTLPSPVYLGTEELGNRAPKSISPGTYMSNNETSDVSQNVGINATGSPDASEFDYTSSFIKRISNLVSEIKSPGDSIKWNHTQNDSRFKKGKAYTISVRVEAKEVGNRTNEHSRSRTVHHSSRSSARHSKPWNIDFLDGPVSPRTYNASYNRKKHSTLDIIKEDNVNKNREKISNGHGGFVLKKVRLKRYIPMQTTLENRPAISIEKFIQYLRDRLVTFLRRILNVYR